MTVLEFYDGTALVAFVESAAVPPVGSKISIRKKMWTVARITYAVDYSDDPRQRRLRVNIDLTDIDLTGGDTW